MNHSTDLSDHNRVFMQEAFLDSHSFALKQTPSAKGVAASHETSSSWAVENKEEESEDVHLNFRRAYRSLYEMHRYVLTHLKNLSDDEIKKVLQLRPRHYFSLSFSVRSNASHALCLIRDFFVNRGNSNEKLICDMQKKVAYSYFTRLFIKQIEKSNLRHSLEELQDIDYHIAALENSLESTEDPWLKAKLYLKLRNIRPFFEKTKENFKSGELRCHIGEIKALFSDFNKLAQGAPEVEKALHHFEKENRELLSFLQLPPIYCENTFETPVFLEDASVEDPRSTQIVDPNSSPPRCLKKERESRMQGEAPHTYVDLHSASIKQIESPRGI